MISDILQKKQATGLGNVAGVNLGGAISSVDYDDIFQNIDGFNKESRRFREDSTKIVLEKNSTLRAFANSGFQFFRKIQCDGQTKVKINKDVYEKFIEGGFPPIYLYFIPFIAFIFLLFRVDDKIYLRNPLPYVWIIITIILTIALTVYIVIKKRNYKKWIEEISKTPYYFLKRNYDGTDKKIDIVLDICISMKESRVWYSELLKEMSVMSSKLKASIGWLWCYRIEEVSDMYNLEIANKDSPFQDKIYLNIGNLTDRLLPFIETEYSFVFFIPPGYDGYNFKSYIPEVAEKARIQRIFDDKHYIVLTESKFETNKERMFQTFDLE